MKIIQRAHLVDLKL